MRLRSQRVDARLGVSPSCSDAVETVPGTKQEAPTGDEEEPVNHVVYDLSCSGAALCQARLANGKCTYQSVRNMRGDEQRFFWFHPAEASMSTSTYPWRDDTSSSNRRACPPVSGMRTINNIIAGKINPGCIQLFGKVIPLNGPCRHPKASARCCQTWSAVICLDDFVQPRCDRLILLRGLHQQLREEEDGVVISRQIGRPCQHMQHRRNGSSKMVVSPYPCP